MPPIEVAVALIHARIALPPIEVAVALIHALIPSCLFSQRECTLQATEEEQADAVAALGKYEMLCSYHERTRFIAAFVEAGEGKEKGSLKFAYKFSQTLEHTESTSVSSNEEYRTPGEILSLVGRSFKDFNSTRQAIVDVEYLVAKNAEEFEWSPEEFPAKIDTVKPEYSRYWYIKSNGKTQSFNQIQKKKFEGEAMVKGVKQMEGTMNFMEGLGFAGDSSNVNIESVKHAELMKVCATLKYTYLFIDSWKSLSNSFKGCCSCS